MPKTVLRIFLIFLVSFLASCASKIDMVNDDFKNQYGSEVDRINKGREAFEREQKAPSYIKSKKTYGWNDPAVIIGVAGSYRYKSAYIDTSKLKLKPEGEQFLPNMQTLLQNGGYHKLPDNMFEVKYLAVNYPDSYGRSPVSFDDIAIPAKDAYGVETSMGDKNYTLINGKVLQRNVDNINSSTAFDDNEVRSMLVKEQKELDRKKRLGLLKSKDDGDGKENKKDKKEPDSYSKSESTIN
jgi:hypothetical protein